MKPLSVLGLVGALLSSGVALAQTQRLPSEAATAEQRLAEDFGPDRLPNSGETQTTAQNQTSSTLRQIGIGNQATVSQQSPSALGNQAYIVQIGMGNEIGISQNGTGNSATFTQDGQGNSSTITQHGTANKLTGVVKGDRNEVNVLQDGNNNQVTGDIRLSDRVYNIKQYGNNNTLTQFESTVQMPKGYSVEMRGQGINLTIEQSKVVPTH
ncbi:minor curlin subunit [Hymenobacter sp. UYAg731]